MSYRSKTLQNQEPVCFGNVSTPWCFLIYIEK
jgi:hypothetical protein